MRSHASGLSDDELLHRLAASFPVEQREPDAASRHQLSMAVAQLRRAQSPPDPEVQAAVRAPRLRMPRRLSPAILAGAVLGSVVTVSGISYAVGVPVPAAVRSVARVVGLAAPAPPTSTPTLPLVAPTTTTTTVSPAVSAARQAESTLGHALAGSQPPPAVLSHDSSVLAHRLEMVGGSHAAGSAQALSDGQHLLYEACRQEQDSSPLGPGAATANGTTCTAAGGIGHAPSGPTTSVPSDPTSSATHTTTPFGGPPSAGTITPGSGSSPRPDTSRPGSFGGNPANPTHDQPRER